LQEYVNGVLKNKYGDAFIRGNNGAPAHTLLCAPQLKCSLACALLHSTVLYISTAK